MAIAIAIDALRDDVLRQHLYLTRSRRPGTVFDRRVEVAMLYHLDQRQKLRTEEFRTAGNHAKA